MRILEIQTLCNDVLRYIELCKSLEVYGNPDELFPELQDLESKHQDNSMFAELMDGLSKIELSNQYPILYNAARTANIFCSVNDEGRILGAKIRLTSDGWLLTIIEEDPRAEQYVGNYSDFEKFCIEYQIDFVLC